MIFQKDKCQVWICPVMWPAFMSVLFLAINTGCMPEQEAVRRPGVASVYFDIKGYFEREQSRLAGLSRIEKITLVNGVQEQRYLDTFDLRGELAIFSNTDINKPAWSDKYAVDSIFSAAGDLEQLNYSSRDEDMKVKLISIALDQAAVKSIRVESATQSRLAETRQLLTYEPAFGYVIENYQHIPFLSQQNEFRVKVRFL